MKRLDELGISPTPWSVEQIGESIIPEENQNDVWAANNDLVCEARLGRNARLIAAAPKLYEALYDLTIEQECGDDCNKCANRGCVIKKCKVALAEAAGESEVKE